MLSPTAIARTSTSATTWTCFQCQLCEFLLRHRHRSQRLSPRPRCHSISSTHPHRDTSDEADVAQPRNSIVWKHARLQERVIGRPGKRQRVVSERLTKDSLSEATNVIIFNDVKEPPNTPIQLSAGDPLPSKLPTLHALSAEDIKSIEDAVLGRELIPQEAEVNASIDALRPENNIVDKAEYERYQKHLSRGYTFQQLSTYLTRCLRPSAQNSSPAGDNLVGNLATSEWRPGSSPLSKRHAVLVKSTSASTKVKAIDKILRLVWQLTTESEDQAVGEIEMQLEKWQMSMLFDLTHDGKPYYEHFVNTQGLLNSSQIEAWTPANILRITARQPTAEEIIRQLRQGLMNVKPLELNLDPYVPLLNRVGASMGASNLIRDQDIRFVSNITKSVIVQRDETHAMTIYGTTTSRVYSARRLLLSLLEMPSPSSFQGTFDLAESRSRATCKVKKLRHHYPVNPPFSGLHRRHWGLDLFRDAEVLAALRKDENPQNTLAELAEDHNIVQSGQALAEELNCVPEPDQHKRSPVDQATSYWRGETRLSDWKTDFCRLFHPNIARNTTITGSRTSECKVIQAQVPGAETLLTYFETRELPQPLHPHESGKLRKQRSLIEDSEPHFDRRMPYLISHFVPSPSAAKLNPNLPRVEMLFRFSAPRWSGHPRELKLVRLKAVLDEQHLNVHLPHRVVDLRFSRELSLVSNLSAAMQNAAILDFQAKLQESVQAGQGALVALPSLTFKLPQWIMDNNAGNDSSAWADVDVEYLFERFQQVQKLSFIPARDNPIMQELGHEARILIEAFPNNHYLAYGEAEGDAIHGSQTYLSLRRRQAPSRGWNHLGHIPAVEVTEFEEESMPQLGEVAAGEDFEETTVVKAQVDLEDTTSSFTLQLSIAAIQIAQLLTRANTGSLRGSQTVE